MDNGKGDTMYMTDDADLDRLRERGVWASQPPKATRKHDARAWQYGPEEWAVSCTCGFTHADTDEATAKDLVTAHTQPGFVPPAQEPEEEERVLYTSKGHEVPVTMTDKAAHEILSRKLIERRNDFMVSLVEAYDKNGRWTDRQRPWAHKLANEAAAPKPEPKVVAGHVFPRLVGMLTSAATKLKHPKMLAGFDEGTIRVGLAGRRARFPGSVNVTDDGPYEGRTWYGRIHTDGRFEMHRDCPDWVVAALVEFNDDPARAARIQGQRFGRCCFCTRHLETKESVVMGYGPVCADKYGLPWGDVPEGFRGDGIDIEEKEGSDA